jgi:hypothetical protein
MADGALKLSLPDIPAERLKAHATAAGMSPEALATELLGRLLEDPAGVSLPPTRPEDYAGPYVELDDALDAFSAELERRLAHRTG